MLRRRSEAGLLSATAPVSLASRRGLDWFTFFVADLQTGFGPFLSVYLTTQKWTQTDIGLVLSVGSLASLIGQLPGGWVVDRVRSKQGVAAAAVAGIGLAALVIALWPVFLIIVAAKVLHVAASCVLGPAIAAITLGLVGHAAAGERLGRNARFASIGNGLAAGAMGACGYFISPQAVFFVTALLAPPTLLALYSIREKEIDPTAAECGTTDDGPPESGLRRLLSQKGLLVFTGCLLLFHLANTAMLPLVASTLTMRSSRWATALVAACIIIPQVIVALFSPTVGRLAQSWGRYPLLLIGFGALPVRGLLMAWTGDPHVLVLLQVLDGITGAVFGVLVPLTVADLAHGTGRFNLAQGIVGSATGIGATLSTVLSGYIADRLGGSVTFLGLSLIAAGALALLAIFMPETKPHPDEPPSASARPPWS